MGSKEQLLVLPSNLLFNIFYGYVVQSDIKLHPARTFQLQVIGSDQHFFHTKDKLINTHFLPFCKKGKVMKYTHFM